MPSALQSISHLALSRTRLFVVGLALLAATSLARAHAFLDHAEPKVGSTVAAPPTELKVWFTQELEPAFSKLEVQDAQGAAVDKKDAHLDPKD